MLAVVIAFVSVSKFPGSRELLGNFPILASSELYALDFGEKIPQVTPEFPTRSIRELNHTIKDTILDCWDSIPAE